MRVLAAGTDPYESQREGLLEVDLALLEGHHSCPHHTKARKVIAKKTGRVPRFMAWRPPKAWGNNQRSWNYWPRTPVKKGQQGKPRTKDADTNFPAYDVSRSSQASSSAGPTEDGGVKKVLSALLKANHLEIPDELKTILQQDGMEELKAEQRSLNQKRKAYQKLERLKKAKSQKKVQWDTFRSDMHKHLLQEQEKFQKDQEELDLAIAKAQKDIENIENGTMVDMESEDLEELLAEGSSSGDAELRQQLEMAQKQNAEFQAQLKMMSSQLHAYTSRADNIGTPSNPEKMGQMSPQNLNTAKDHEKEAKQKAERHARMKKVQDEMLRQQNSDRERSPRRDSQDLEIDELG